MSVLHPIFGIGDLVMTIVFVGVVTAVPVSIVALVIYRINMNRSRKGIPGIGIDKK